MPDLSTTLHLDMLSASKRARRSLPRRIFNAVKRELVASDVYGLEWGNPDVVFWPTGESGWSDFWFHFGKFYRSIFRGSSESLMYFSFIATWLVFFGGWFWAVLSPTRGLHDRLEKTHIGLR